MKIFFDICLDKLSANGKSIGEVRAKMNWKFNFDQTKPIFFQWN